MFDNYVILFIRFTSSETYIQTGQHAIQLESNCVKSVEIYSETLTVRFHLAEVRLSHKIWFPIKTYVIKGN